MNEEMIVREKWKEINEKKDTFIKREDEKISELTAACQKKFDDNLKTLSPKARKKLYYRDKLIEKNEKSKKTFLIFSIIVSLIIAFAIFVIAMDNIQETSEIFDKYDLPHSLIFIPFSLPVIVLILGLLLRSINKAIRTANIVSIYNEAEINKYMQRKEAIDEEYENGLEKLRSNRYEEETRLKKEYREIKEKMKTYIYKNYIFFYFDTASNHHYEVYIDGVLYESSRKHCLQIKLNPGIHSFKLKAIYDFMDDVRITSFPTTQVDTEDCPQFYTCRFDVFDKRAMQRNISLDEYEKLAGEELDVK